MKNYNKAKKNLKKYISEDKIYQEFLHNQLIQMSDFDLYCIKHCVDIQKLLDRVEVLEKTLKDIIKVMETNLTDKER